MLGLGTIVNAAAIVAGCAIGMLAKRGISQRVMDAVMKGVALCIVYIGIDGMLEGSKTLAVIIAMALGAGIGTLLDLDGKMSKLGDIVEKRLAGGGAGIAQGFVTASLIFCVGAMAVVGSLQSGLSGDNSTLYTKALLDGISSMVLTASLGVGVGLSAVCVLVYQGALTLLAGLLSPVLSDAVIAEMTCVGSILIMALGLNMLGITKIKVMDYILAIFLVIPLCYIM